jgi:AmmeMemoRadiSam system protein A
MLSAEQKRELLGIARSSIVAALQGTSPQPVRPSKELLEPSGAFVTIRIKDRLRGCIGYMESQLPLAEVVAEVAAKAALDDPRFPPLSMAELGQATLEISVLSPLAPFPGEENLTVGDHGLMIELGYRKGVLLPQVAVEYGWDAVEFLEAVCRKAGLAKDAWRDPHARISVFRAEIFDEKELLPINPS